MGPRSPRPVYFFLALVVSVFAWTNTQAQFSTSIEGQVVDPLGAVVPRVEVRAINRAIGVDRLTETDDEGRYEIPALPVGEYRLLVQAEGFNTQVLELIRVRSEERRGGKE